MTKRLVLLVGIVLWGCQVSDEGGGAGDVDAGSDTAANTDTDLRADAEVHNPDTAVPTDSGVHSDTFVPTDPGADTGSDAQTDTGMDSGSDRATDSDSDANRDTGDNADSGVATDTAGDSAHNSCTGDDPNTQKGCTAACPCSEGQGDCDNDDDCLPGLVCVPNVGQNYGYVAETDVCEKPSEDTAIDTDTDSGAVGETPMGQSGSWEVVFEDDFDEAAIDEDVWNIEPASWGSWTWRRDNAFLDNGDLVIRTVREQHTRDGETKYFTSGIAKSRLEFGTGHYYEARIKSCPHHPGFAPAFWLLNPSGQTRTVNGETFKHWEIDIIETLQDAANPRVIDMNLHLRTVSGAWWRPSNHPELKHNWTAPWDPRDDYHIFAVYVTDARITWYIDGEERAVETEYAAYFQGNFNIIFSQGLRWQYHDGSDPGDTLPQQFSTAFRVDWVRVYRRK